VAQQGVCLGQGVILAGDGVCVSPTPGNISDGFILKILTGLKCVTTFLCLFNQRLLDVIGFSTATLTIQSFYCGICGLPTTAIRAWFFLANLGALDILIIVSEASLDDVLIRIPCVVTTLLNLSVTTGQTF